MGKQVKKNQVKIDPVPLTMASNLDLRLIPDGMQSLMRGPAYSLILLLPDMEAI